MLESSGVCACGCGGRTTVAPQTRAAKSHIQGQPVRYINGHNQRERWRQERPTTAKASRSPRIRELEWAAGFLDGEGSFSCKDGHSDNVSAAQNDPELLHKLLRLFGGRIYLAHNRLRGSTHHHWYCCGARARGVAMTLYPLLSKRRQTQIKAMLARMSFKEYTKERSVQ